MRSGYAVALSSGRTVEIVAPTVEDVLKAQRAAGDKTGMRGATRATQALLRLVLRKIDGRPVSAAEALGTWPLDAVETDELLGTVGAVSSCDDAALEACRASVAIADDGKVKRWTAILPPALGATEGRTVTLRVLPFGDVADAMGSADEEGSAALAGQFRGSLEGIRKSIEAVGDADVSTLRRSPTWLADWPLTAAETAAAADLWRAMHTAGRGPRPTAVPTATG